MRRARAAASLAFGLVVAAGSMVVAQEAATLHAAADGSAEYDTITDALEAASDGDTILIAPGEYLESFIVDKAITLRGTAAARDTILLPEPREAFTRVDAADDEFTAGIVVESVDATIENLMIQHVEGVAAGILLDGGSPTVRDIETDAIVGVNGTTVATIEDSVVHRVNLVGPDVRATVRGNTIADGMWVVDGATGTVERNLIQEEPIVVGADSSAEIIGNTLRPAEGAPAIHVEWANASVDVVDNTVEGGAPSIFVQHARSARIQGNTITEPLEGIVVLETDAIVRDNTVIDAADAGIVLEGNGITAEGNTVNGGRVGMVAGVPNGYPPNAPRFDEPSRIIGNTIADASHFGLLVFDSSPVVSGNSICAGREPIRLEDDASPELGSNEVCEIDG